MKATPNRLSSLCLCLALPWAAAARQPAETQPPALMANKLEAAVLKEAGTTCNLLSPDSQATTMPAPDAMWPSHGTGDCRDKGGKQVARGFAELSEADSQKACFLDKNCAGYRWQAFICDDLPYGNYTHPVNGPDTGCDWVDTPSSAQKTFNCDTFQEVKDNCQKMCGLCTPGSKPGLTEFYCNGTTKLCPTAADGDADTSELNGDGSTCPYVASYNAKHDCKKVCHFKDSIVGVNVLDNVICPASSETFHFTYFPEFSAEATPEARSNDGSEQWCRKKCADKEPRCSFYAHYEHSEKQQGKCVLYGKCAVTRNLRGGQTNKLYHCNPSNNLAVVPAVSNKKLNLTDPPCSLLTSPDLEVFRQALSSKFGEGNILYLGDSTMFYEAATLHNLLTSANQTVPPTHAEALSTFYIPQMNNHSFVVQWDKLLTMDELLHYVSLNTSDPNVAARSSSSVLQAAKVIVLSVPAAEVQLCEPDNLIKMNEEAQSCTTFTKLQKAVQTLVGMSGIQVFIRETPPYNQQTGCCAHMTQYCPPDTPQRVTARWCKNDFIRVWNKAVDEKIAAANDISMLNVFEHSYKNDKETAFGTDSTGHNFDLAGREMMVVQELQQMCAQIDGELPKSSTARADR